MKMSWNVVLFAVLWLAFMAEAKRCYDHQTSTYKAHEQFRLANTCSSSVPSNQQQPQLCSVTPFFSPDNALEAHMQLIQEAQESIAIANPNIVTWNQRSSSCRKHVPHNSHHSTQCGVGCTGCELSHFPGNESFPLFAALLNAVHLRNITVRILTNNYSVPTCPPDRITLLDWFSMNKVSVRLYKTTTFLHEKFMMIDSGKKTLVSSVNFSKVSFMKNRESGVIISQCEDCDVVKLYKSVFEFDWKEADHYILDNQYTDEQIKMITDPRLLPYIIVPSPSERVKGINVTMELKTFPDVQISGYVAPDYARETFFKMLNQTASSISVHIYSITDKEICQNLIALKMAGVKVTVLASRKITSYFEKIDAQACYKKLTESGIKVRYTYSGFEFSHQKYWIVDNKTVFLSTGNWDGTDFAKENEWMPQVNNVNRDMIVIMENSHDLVQFFSNIFQHDFELGSYMT